MLGKSWTSFGLLILGVIWLLAASSPATAAPASAHEEVNSPKFKTTEVKGRLYSRRTKSGHGRITHRVYYRRSH